VKTAVSVIYSGGVTVALVTRHVKYEYIRHIRILSSVAFLVVTFF